jgi:hypothetical protein
MLNQHFNLVKNTNFFQGNNVPFKNIIKNILSCDQMNTKYLTFKHFHFQIWKNLKPLNFPTKIVYKINDFHAEQLDSLELNHVTTNQQFLLQITK